MNIASRYLLKEFGRVLFLTITTFILIYFIVDFLERIDNFVEAGVPLTRVAFFFLMTIPSILFNLTPVGILVSVLISLGLLARNSEIVAFKAAGVSVFRLAMPIFLASILISVLLFVMADTLIPYTSARVNHIWNIEVEKQKEETHIRQNVWIRAPGGVFNFRVYDERNRTIEGVRIFYFDKDFHLIKRIEAAYGRLGENSWTLRDGITKEYLPDGEIKVRQFDREEVDLPDMPEEIAQTQRASEEMSSRELSAWIKRMESDGYDPLRYQVDLQLKYSFPFICAIMAIIGLPIAFWKEKGGGIALGVGVGIGLSFAYLVFLGLSRSLGYSGLLPPAAAAWLPNMLFSLLGFYLFTHVRQ